MYNFPSPQPDELVYSLLARARVKFCEVSPKVLIEKVFGSRSVISSLHFPSRIQPLVSGNLNSTISTIELIYNHTLFPLYAPFIPEERRLMCVQAMHDKSFGQPYLATGFAASRIPNITGMRYCPDCMAKQIAEHGEPYWQRIHQVSGLESCTQHNTKLEVASYYQSRVHRHEYFPASNILCKAKPKRIHSEYDIRLYQPIRELLNRGDLLSPNYSQWTQYYQYLIGKNHCNKGRYVSYEAIKERILAEWSIDWLKRYNLHHLDEQSSWLHAITRKHRKSFSYLEHLVVLKALIDGLWSINHVIEDVLSLKAIIVCSPTKKVGTINAEVIRTYKKKWLSRVRFLGTKLGRIAGGGSVYAWLYRHQRNWLLKLNRHYKRPIHHSLNRIDWSRRDKNVVKELIKVRNSMEENMDQPRQSKNWFMNQLNRKETISKNLNKLPLTQEFLNRYEETVTDYQIRRLSRTIITHYPKLPPRWVLLRESGLNDKRIKELADNFLSIEIEN
ncbi:hypothetical protein CJF42_02780 [Pseudoalteromonas sp. NBT06-2]|uniref:TnsD family Tn7-like transposition protein n=1 Tax=Pseudoalteromonas sp. NBT06-2 TaxID=2025950 RepID=UPI000BA5B35F|nr:TnsD family Tn7-like transposition protein [Pseudoalteromonas sp. NBT06-2]PAJ75966.1 hypothetical protein CJF42_02780 [Pseudoalteromonas sp. NBT06-2]